MMDIDVRGQRTYCYTGGRPFDPRQPSAIFVHGALHDHSVWILQSRYLAHHGWNVLAIDLPGHCRSAGTPPVTVEDAADFLLALMDAAGIERAALIGHSLGSLIVLEAAARAPARVSHLVLVGTAFPMKVSAALLHSALHTPQQAIDLVNVYSRSTLAPPPSVLGPGTWIFGAVRALMRRVLASNPRVNLFHTGFKACDDYANGLQAMDAVTAPVLFVLGRKDQMTPPKAAQALVTRARDARVVHVPVGHHQMSEAPDATLAALREFLGR